MQRKDEVKADEEGKESGERVGKDSDGRELTRIYSLTQTILCSI